MTLIALLKKFGSFNFFATVENSEYDQEILQLQTADKPMAS